jgi:hypothetical protein
MPITQTRMIAVLDEFERNMAIHRKLIAEIENLAARIEISDPQSFRQMLNFIIAEAKQYYQCPNAQFERRHFNSVERRNDRNRVKMEQKRRARGMRKVDSPEYRDNARRLAQLRQSGQILSMEEEQAYYRWNAAQEKANKEYDKAFASTNPDDDKPFSLTQEEMEQEAREGTVSEDDISGL